MTARKQKRLKTEGRRPKEEQLLFDFDLPDDQAAARDRIKAIRHHFLKLIEDLPDGAGGLEGRRLQRVKETLKRLMKDKVTNWDGTGTFRTAWLARDWIVAERTLRRRLAWARDADLITTSVSTDSERKPRTTIQYNWRTIADYVGRPVLPPDPEVEQPVTKAGCIEMEQPATKVQQPATKAEQPAITTGDSVYRSSVKTVDEAAAASLTWEETEQHVENRLVEIGDKLPADTLRVAKQLEYTPAEILEACDWCAVNQDVLRNPGGALDWWMRHDRTWPADDLRDPRIILEARRARAARIAKAEAKARALETENEAWRVEYEALDAAYGAEFDALSEDQQLELARLCFTTGFELERWRRGDLDARYRLLVFIHENRAREAKRVDARMIKVRDDLVAALPGRPGRGPGARQGTH